MRFRIMKAGVALVLAMGMLLQPMWAKADPIVPTYQYSSFYTDATGDAQYDDVYGEYVVRSTTHQHNGDTRALMMKLLNEPDNSVRRLLTYCMDVGTPFQPDLAYHMVGTLDSYTTGWGQDAAKKAQVRYILANSMPNKTLQEVQTLLGNYTLTVGDVVLGTQTALWYITNSAELQTVSNLKGGSTSANVNAVYSGLVSKALAEYTQSAYQSVYGVFPSMDIKPKESISVDSNGRYGPFTFSTSTGVDSALKVDVWLEGLPQNAGMEGVTIQSAQGQTLASGINTTIAADANSCLTSNSAQLNLTDAFYVVLPPSASYTSVSLRARTAATVTGMTEAIFMAGSGSQPTATICPVQFRLNAGIKLTKAAAATAAPAATAEPVLEGEFETMEKTGIPLPVAPMAAGAAALMTSVVAILKKKRH